MTTYPERMADHWWWRPGWSVGRSFYTFHLTFQDQPEVHRFAAGYRAALEALDGLDLIPDRWLHLTMQGIGFVDEVGEDAVEAIVRAATARLAAVRSFGIALDRPVIDPEALLFPVQPAESVVLLRHAVREAIGEVLAEVPENADGFMPHVSLAYSKAEGPAAPIAAAVAGAAVEPVKTLVRHAELIRINRDHRMYQWTSVAKVPLG